MKVPPKVRRVVGVGLLLICAVFFGHTALDSGAKPVERFNMAAATAMALAMVYFAWRNRQKASLKPHESAFDAGLRVLCLIAVLIVLLTADGEVNVAIRKFLFNYLGPNHISVTVVVLVAGGICLSVLRKEDLFNYACVEMLFGLFSAYQGATKEDISEFERWAIFGAAVYFIAGALDDLDKGIKARGEKQAAEQQKSRSKAAML
jgi:hypothetical protein